MRKADRPREFGLQALLLSAKGERAPMRGAPSFPREDSRIRCAMILRFSRSRTVEGSGADRQQGGRENVPPGWPGQTRANLRISHDPSWALTVGTQIKGLRLRAGNLQVGDGAILESLFTETRFNSWSVGEVHVLDPRLIPNGRRDQFEQNAHYANLLNHLLPTARDIANRCRTYSSRRSKLREFEATSAAVRERLSALRQGGLGEPGKSSALAAAEATLQKLKNHRRLKVAIR
ncbi:hypothetical protein [Ancylobacter sp. G4_0304]|uniref:hypothetical protein n=1 Tax=Ancylobacter sp. G4_0304 TaxID=3114289 RepID=UPI0039C6A18D